MDFLGSLISSIGNIFGASKASDAATKQAEANRNMQWEIAANRIQMTKADADAAGINPLAALGNATQSYSNVAGDTSLGEGIAKAGQDVGRAVAALAPQKLRAAELENKLTEAKIANVNSDTVANQMAASQVATKLGQPGTPPAYPPMDKSLPYPRPDPRGPVIELEQRARDRDGSIVLIPSEKAASPLQTQGAWPTNMMMGLRSAGDYFSDNVYGPAMRAAQRFNDAVYDRNNSGY